jgi:hypothetical protein
MFKKNIFLIKPYNDQDFVLSNPNSYLQSHCIQLKSFICLGKRNIIRNSPRDITQHLQEELQQ